jgi:hypothetical protein
MRIEFNDSIQSLWDSTKAQVFMRYRGFFSRKSVRQRKLDRMELLNIAISGQWQTALELSRKTSIPFHQAVKLLQIAQWRFDIETKRIDYIDERKRQRTKTLYRRKHNITGLAALFGMRAVDVPKGVGRVHICRDD